VQAAVAVDEQRTVQIIYEARKNGIRHAPQWCCLALASVGKLSRKQLFNVEVGDGCLQRPDDAMELVALYWKDGKKPLPAALKRGIADYLQSLDEYRLAKYGSRDGAVKLRDLFFLCHPKPKNKTQEKLWHRWIDGKLEPADTWETELSAGKDKKDTWERLITEKKLGTLALIRNLRNMIDAGVERSYINLALVNARTEKIFPYQIMQAARYAPGHIAQLDALLVKCLGEYPKLCGTTVFLVDVSASMQNPMSSKSEMNRRDGAVALAIMLREICEDPVIFEFDGDCRPVKGVRGLGLDDEISMAEGGSTDIKGAIVKAVAEVPKMDRLVLLTDEQSFSDLPIFGGKPVKKYLINVATEKNGIAYKDWTHLDGFSQNIVEFIVKHEASTEA
jgi:hypothetical protein